MLSHMHFFIFYIRSIVKEINKIFDLSKNSKLLKSHNFYMLKCHLATI